MGNVLIIYKNCEWKYLNKLNQSNDLCAYSLTYNDYCLNHTTLIERTCFNNKIFNVNITCSNKCNNGLCL